MTRMNLRPTWLRGFLVSTAVIAGGTTAFAGPVEDLETPRAEHHTQAQLNANGFLFTFDAGDEFFETPFNALDGGGANVGDGAGRFTRVPRADLDGPGEWEKHFPPRATGPNGQACNECHLEPFGTFAGNSATAVHRDPLRKGNLFDFIRRDTPSLHGAGALQRLAEEMTDALHAQRAAAGNKACATGYAVKKKLVAKGVHFGGIKAMPGGGYPCVATYDTSHVVGVDENLVIKPFQWKGTDATIRVFGRGAFHNELGMQPVEIVKEVDGSLDGDFDGVIDEVSIGDVTSVAIYLAGQPRATTRQELARLGIIDPLTHEEKEAIWRGGNLFKKIGCANCHRPRLFLKDPIFSEPSLNPQENMILGVGNLLPGESPDGMFPAGQVAVDFGVNPADPISFDLTADLPDNIVDKPGRRGGVFHLGNFQTNRRGHAIVRLFGDLKRHDMGDDPTPLSEKGLAENIDEQGTGRDNWLTKELWGVGSTDPYLHDGRATTLTEAIIEHGGEAKTSRHKFLALPVFKQAAVIAYLNNLVLFKAPEEE